MKITQQGFFVGSIIITAVLLYYLASVLTPFLFGALLAYLSEPAVRWLEKHKWPHMLSVVVVFIVLMLAILLFLLMLVPLIEKQIVMLISFTPQIIAWLDRQLSPWMDKYFDLETMKSSLSFTLSKSGWVFGVVMHSGHALMSWIVSIVLTPVVTFYLLRDWDSLLESIKNYIPKEDRAIWIKMAKSCDEVLSAFFRGQLMVMLCLAMIYGVGLTLIGLEVGFIIGFVGGMLSIVPYLGSIFVLVFAAVTALVQYGTLDAVGWVLVVYIVGQVMEGYVLTPYFVGNRIGLHPVFVIFAVMSGGVLFGTVGILLALPASAVIKVLLGYAKRRYMPA